jgi:hypothetical protein
MGTGLDAGEVWALWRRLVRALPMVTVPFDTLFAPSARTLWGVDYLSGLRRNRSTQKIFDLLAPLGPDDLRRMHALAQINHRRQEAVSRWMAVSSITLPVSGALALSQLAPELLAQIRRDWLDLSVTSLAIVAAVVVFYLVAAWRARQLATIVELAVVERGVSLDGAASEADLDPPVLLES